MAIIDAPPPPAYPFGIISLFWNFTFKFHYKRLWLRKRGATNVARLSIQSEQVKHLVDTQVLPLLLATGTVGALTKLLNEKLLNTGTQSRLHPNRLHTLLSNDATSESPRVF